MKKSITPWNRIALIVVLVITVFGVIMVLSNLDQIVVALRQADLSAIPGAIFFTAISYFFVGLAFALVCRIYAIPVRMRDTVEIGISTTVINHVVTAGGVAGYTIRLILMTRLGAKGKDVLAASILHYYITSLDMLTMLPISLAYLYYNVEVPRTYSIVLGIIGIIMGVAIVLFTSLIFFPSMRIGIIRMVNSVAQQWLRRDFETQLLSFNDSISTGVDFMKRKPASFLSVLGLTFIDWVASVLVLGFCLDAFGPAYPFGVQMTGFVLGIVAGALSMVPGGYGVQEGTSVLILVLLGVPFGQALLATILFRAIYYFLPYMVSLISYRRMRQAYGISSTENPAIDV